MNFGNREGMGSRLGMKKRWWGGWELNKHRPGVRFKKELVVGVLGEKGVDLKRI